MDSPDKFGIGQAGPETPVSPPPVETRVEPALPQEGERPQPQEEPKVAEPAPEMVIEAPPQVGEIRPVEPVETAPAPVTPKRIGEHDLSGDIDIASAAALQEELNA